MNVKVEFEVDVTKLIKGAVSEQFGALAKGVTISEVSTPKRVVKPSGTRQTKTSKSSTPSATQGSKKK